MEGCFDLVLAFEVLEHYLDDRQCLDRWRELLAPDGTLLFSVPAHQRRWTSNDDRAGHARRYEKAELMRKLSQSGFAVERFCCYGFPVLNWTYPLSSLLFPGRGVVTGPAGPDPDRLPTATGSMKDFGRTAGSGVRRFARLSQWLLKEWAVAAPADDATALSAAGSGYRLHGEVPEDGQPRFSRGAGLI